MVEPPIMKTGMRAEIAWHKQQSAAKNGQAKCAQTIMENVTG
jgi:hypothetical protein